MVSTSIPSLRISPSPSTQFLTKNPPNYYYAPRRPQNCQIHPTTAGSSSSSSGGNGRLTTVCRATRTNSFDALDSLMSSMADFDLYDLLGVERDSDNARIKTAYRLLQKRCHPDIAGPAGHDMAIILNEAYALLSDPASRSAYDKELAKMREIRGYNGKPLYSVWVGSESEQRAVFVDEVKCVGCLKCALFAGNTFAIESVYGRARVVAQWADPEPTIQEAIDTCPVDCISIVDRTDLPALEFLMSKQPRGRVRIGVGNTVGARTFDVFDELKLLKKRFDEANKNKQNLSSSEQGKQQESDVQRDRRISAVQAIRSITNWLNQQQPLYQQQSTPTYLQIHHNPHQHKAKSPPTDPALDKLKAIAAKRRQAIAQGSSTRLITSSNSLANTQDEYWVPTNYNLPSDEQTSMNPAAANEADPPTSKPKQSNEKQRRNKYRRERPPRVVWWGTPLGSALMGAVYAGLQLQDNGAQGGGRLEEHVAGPLALEIVNSFWLHVMQAGVAWYITGAVVAQGVDLILARRRD